MRRKIMRKKDKRRILIIAVAAIVLLIAGGYFVLADKYPNLDVYEQYVVNVIILDHVDYEAMEAEDTVKFWEYCSPDNESVRAWLKLNEEETKFLGDKKYDLYVGSDIPVVAPENVILFDGFSSLKKVTGLEYIDMRNVKSLENAFRNCYELTEIDVSSFNTSNVTTMKGMFSGCDSLAEIDGIENFDMKNVNDVSGMFMDCSSLTKANIQELDLENIQINNDCFLNCPLSIN